MNRIVVSVAFILLINYCSTAQSPVWQWAQGIHGSGYEHGLNIAIDRDNNIYASGVFTSDTMTAGGFSGTDTTQYTNFFIAKYDTSGQIIWFKSYGGSLMEYGGPLYVDDDKNIYFTGHFDSPQLNIEGVVLVNSSSPNVDFFIMKMDSTGMLLWVKSFHGDRYDASNDLSVDASGNIYLNGCSNSTVLDFGGISISSGALNDFFTAKFDASGNVIWVQTAKGGQYEWASNLERDNLGYFYSVCVSESQNLVFSGNQSIAFSHFLGYDIYVAKYDSAGALIDVKSFGGESHDDGAPIAFDDENNMYLSGRFLSKTIDVEGILLTNPDSSSENFLVKYNSDGQALWVRQFAGDGIVSNMCISQNGTLLMCGFFSDSICLGDITLTNPAYGSAFIAECDTDGNILWAKCAGISGANRAIDIATDNSCGVYLGGDFGGPYIDFDGIILTNDDSSTTDCFMAKLGYSCASANSDDFCPVAVPNAFSPNADGNNDVLYVRSNCASSVLFRIYDRWGEKIFESQSLDDGWDGTIHGNPAQTGVYFYYVKAVDFFGHEQYLKGNITLVR